MWPIMEKLIVAKKGENVLDVALDAMIALLGGSMLAQAIKLFSRSCKCDYDAAN